MNRMYWLSLCWCILTCLVVSSDAAVELLSLCKKIVTGPQGEVDLDCRNMKIDHIPTNIFYITNKRIYLSENPYSCKCDIAWFLEALRKKSIGVQIVDKDLMTCATPGNLKGRLIKDMRKSVVCPTPEEANRCLQLSCSKHATCVQNSTTGLGQCACNTGLKENGTSCKDIDECSLGSHTCATYQDCLNIFGSFECRCKSGLKLNSKGHCEAPEPCEIMLRPCDSDKEVCINKKRGYACACKEGYYKESESQEDCKDVNECQQRHSCSKEAWCFNKIGSYQCLCKEGYTGDGKNCEDIDECETGDHHCPKEGVCVNSVGGYKCYCKSGYEMNKNGTHCIKQDEKFWLQKENIIYGGAGMAVLLVITVCCCCCCCCRRKSKNQNTESKEKLVGDKALKANQDLMNMAMEQDPFLLQQQDQLEQQMYMFNMQQQQHQYMPYFGGNDPAVSGNGVPRNESAMSTWSDENEYMEYYADAYH